MTNHHCSYLLSAYEPDNLPAGFFNRQPILVSACLLGCPVRYDSKSKPASFLPLSKCLCVPICPEQLGGLPTPRPKQWLCGGDGRDVLDGKARVINVNDVDVTKFFIAGAERTLAIAKHYGANLAFLKGRSPSCGCTTVWIDEEKAFGLGVTTALLRRHGIVCIEVN